MAIDLRDLELEIARRKGSDQPYWAEPLARAIADIPRQRMDAEKWKEQKNVQRQRIMSDLAKDTSRLYSNKDAQFQRDIFQKYFDRHEGSMDESTLEMGQIMLGNFDYQIAQNDDFIRYKDGMDSQMQKIDDFLKKPEFEIGKEYTDKEVEEFREVYQGYVDFTEKFTTDHADRLQLAGNSHVIQELSHGSYANKFMLDSFYGDKKIDETEYKAYSQALASNSLEPITKYKEYEKTIIERSNKSLLDSMDNNAELLRNYNLVKDGALDMSALGKDFEGSYEMATDEEQDMIREAIVSLEDELQEDNKRHIERHGKDYLYDPKIGILSKGKKSEGGDGGELTEENKSSLKSLGYSDSDISGMKYESALNVINKGIKKDISSYAEERRIISESKQKGIKTGGDKVIDELIQLDKDKVTTRENIASLKKEHTETKDRKKEVDEEIEALRAVNILAVGDEASKKKFKDLKKEQALLNHRLKSGGSYWHISYLGRIDTLEDKLKELEEKRNSNKKKLKQYLKVA